MASLDLLMEAERRGILPPDKKQLLDEARRRGLVSTPGIPELRTAPENAAEIAIPSTQPGEYLMGGPQGAFARGAEAVLGYAPTALRVAGGLLPPVPGIGASSEYLARAAEVGTGQRGQEEMLNNLGRSMAAQEVVNRIVPKPAGTLRGALAKGLGTGAAVSTVAPLVEKGDLPSKEQFAVGTLLGGLLGGAGYKLEQVVKNREAAQQLAQELADLELQARQQGAQIGVPVEQIWSKPDLPTGGFIPTQADLERAKALQALASGPPARMFPTPQELTAIQAPARTAEQGARAQMLTDIQQAMTTRSPELPRVPVSGEPQAGTALSKLPEGEVLPPVQELLRTAPPEDQSLLALAQRTITPRATPVPIESSTSALLRQAQEVQTGRPETLRDIFTRKLTEETGAVGKNIRIAGTSVVDEAGQPLRVYHGTPRAFQEFSEESQRRGMYGKGFYFTEDPSVTSGYSGLLDQQRLPQMKEELRQLEDSLRARGETLADSFHGQMLKQRVAQFEQETPNVHPVYLRIQRPFDVDAQVVNPDPAVKAAAQQLLRTKQGKSPEDYLELAEGNYQEAQRIFARVQNAPLPEDPLRYLDGEEIGQLARKLGYDGLTHIGGDIPDPLHPAAEATLPDPEHMSQVPGTRRHRVWIAFDKAQVVSAIGQKPASLRDVLTRPFKGEVGAAGKGAQQKEAFVYHGTTARQLPALLKALREGIGKRGLSVTETPELAARYANAQASGVVDPAVTGLTRPDAVVLKLKVPEVPRWIRRGTAQGYTGSLDAVEAWVSEATPLELAEVITQQNIPIDQLTKEVSRFYDPTVRGYPRIVDQIQEELNQLKKPSTLRKLLTGEEGKITLRRGALPPMRLNIENLATRLMQQGIPQDAAVQQAANIRLDKALEGIPDTDQLRRLQQEVINSNLPLIEYARRGVRPQDVTQEAALKLGLTEEQLLKRPLGRSANAEEILAAGYVADRSAIKLQQVLQGVQAGTATEPEFVEALAKHVAVMEQYSGSVAEAGRALNILRKQRDGQIAAAQALQDLFKAKDTPEAIRAKLGELMQRNPTMFNKTLQEMRKATTLDKLYEFWINGRLSGPQTHAVNFLSNALTDMWRVAESGVSGVADAARVAVSGGQRERYTGEALADIHGQVMGLNDAVRAALVAWREQGPDLGKIEYRQAIEGTLGKRIRSPGRALQAADAFWKTLGQRGALHAQAYRQAMQEGLEGAERTQRIAALIAQPPEALTKAADAEALLRTFQTPLGPRAAAWLHARNVTPGARYIAPFIRTPLNVAKFGIERSPLTFLRPGFYRAIKEGGGKASEEWTKAVLGSALLGLGAYLAANKIMTGGGPIDPAERQALYTSGWQPYSIKVGDQYVSFGRLEPLAMVFGLGADFAEIADQVALEKEDAAAALAILPALQRNLTNKTFLKGITDFVEMYNDSGRFFQSWLQSMVGSVVPTGVATVARAWDPTLRDPEGIMEGIRTLIPGLSQEIPPLRDIWGQPAVRVGSFGEQLLSPLRRGVDTNDLPTQEILRLQPIAEEMGLAMLPGSPSKALTIKGQKLEMTRQEYDAYVEASGGLARQLWERVVAADSYQQLPDTKKAELADKVFEKARSAARTMTLARIGQSRPQSIRDLLKKGIELEAVQ